MVPCFLIKSWLSIFKTKYRRHTDRKQQNNSTAAVLVVIGQAAALGMPACRRLRASLQLVAGVAVGMCATKAAAAAASASASHLVVGFQRSNTTNTHRLRRRVFSSNLMPRALLLPSLPLPEPHPPRPQGDSNHLEHRRQHSSTTTTATSFTPKASPAATAAAATPQHSDNVVGFLSEHSNILSARPLFVSSAPRVSAAGRPARARHVPRSQALWEKAMMLVPARVITKVSHWVGRYGCAYCYLSGRACLPRGVLAWSLWVGDSPIR